jgi:hypothetical protein
MADKTKKELPCDLCGTPTEGRFNKMPLCPSDIAKVKDFRKKRREGKI